MRRTFNTGGPCEPTRNYMLPASQRLPGVRQLIDDQLYFVLHAPRQSGKTTAMIQLANELTAEGRYAALVVSAEQGARVMPGADPEMAMLGSWRTDARLSLPPEMQPPEWPEADASNRLRDGLTAWAMSSPRPLVVLLDEIDSLKDDTLASVLRQLRNGFRFRPKGFPWALALIGLRDVRDDHLASGGSSRQGSPSPFNILAESLTLGNFSRDEVASLCGQHTSDTGQVFLGQAVDRAHELTQGQPWLINALARQLVEKLVPDGRAITATDVDAAREILIQRRDTHLDSLAERLREDRVRRVIEPLLAGTTLGDVSDDDRRYVVDLGLLRTNRAGGLEVANPIYKEVLPRVLASGPQSTLPGISPTWLRSDGTLDPDALLESFLAFWRQHAEPLFGSAPYHEIAPHLVLMAFLHRVVNGGGTIDREYAIGRGRMDLLVRYAGARLALELKVWRDGESDPLREGLSQLDTYLDGLALQTGWLVIFDRREGQPRVAARTSAATAGTPTGRTVTVIRA